MWSLHFFWRCLHTCTPKASVIRELSPSNTAPYLPSKRVICLPQLGLPFSVVGSAPQWAVRHRASIHHSVLRWAVFHGEVRAAGSTKIGRWVFFVVSSRILRLFWLGNMHGESTQWLGCPFSMMKSRNSTFDVCLPFSDGVKLAWILGGGTLQCLGERCYKKGWRFISPEKPR